MRCPSRERGRPARKWAEGPQVFKRAGRPRSQGTPLNKGDFIVRDAGTPALPGDAVCKTSLDRQDSARSVTPGPN